MTSELIGQHIDDHVGVEAGARGEVYAQWINAVGVSDVTLQDKNHPFTIEYDSCRNFGAHMLAGAKKLQGDS